MASEDVIQKSDVAYGDVTAATGALTGQLNCTCVRNGAGDYSVTIGKAVNEAECHISLEVKTAALSGTIVHTSDTVKQFLFLDTASGLVPTDCDFSFVISQMVGAA